MRWVGLVILGYGLVLIQTSVGAILVIPTAAVGPIRPDLVALLAVFVALHARSATDAALAAWGLGLAVDLTSAGAGPAPSVVGPMALGYVLAAAALFRMREMLYRDRPGPQMLLAALFAALSHGLWVTLQSLRALGQVTWPEYGQMWAQVLGLAVYTGLVMPLGHWLFMRLHGWLFDASPTRTRRARS